MDCFVASLLAMTVAFWSHSALVNHRGAITDQADVLKSAVFNQLTITPGICHEIVAGSNLDVHGGRGFGSRPDDRTVDRQHQAEGGRDRPDPTPGAADPHRYRQCHGPGRAAGAAIRPRLG